MAQCKIDNCGREVFEDKAECILHYPKDTKEVEVRHSREFINALHDHIYTLISNKSGIPFDGVKQQFTRNAINLNLGSRSIELSEIHFPNIKEGYKDILKNLEIIEFKNCHFYGGKIETPPNKLSFELCVFHNNWLLTQNISIKEKPVYSSCEFKNNVSNGLKKYTVSLFESCKFDGQLQLSNVEFDKAVFISDHDSSNRINKILLRRCYFNKDFSLFNSSIGQLECYNSEFRDRFKLIKNSIGTLKYENVTHKRPADFTKSNFGAVDIKDSTFFEYVYMNECELGTEKLLEDRSKPAKFVNVNFMSFINFRKAKFHSGLSIRDVNFNDAPNFLNVTITDQNTDRETYRIVKNSFDRIQNYIEANEFYQKEMLKWREELKEAKNKLWLRALLFMYAKFSNYGLDFTKPLKWIFILATLYTLVIHSYEENWLYPSWFPLNSFFNSVFTFINTIAKNVIPFNRWVYEGIEALSLLFYIFFASLIWLVILAIKRNTKR